MAKHFPQISAPVVPRRALVTGAGGLIGSALARELLAEGWQVVGVDDFSSGWAQRLPSHARFQFVRGDIGEDGMLSSLLAQQAPFESLVHLAARVGVRRVLRDPEGCRASNLRGVDGLLRALRGLRTTSLPRVWAASTSEVYAEAERPLREGDATRAVGGAGRWAYAGSKLEGELRLDACLGQLAGAAPAVHLRFFNVVGPGQDAQSGMVLPNFVEQALRGADLGLHGDGSAVRTFAHVDEVARTLAQLLGRGTCPGGALNVGGSARTTIANLARCVIACTGSASRIVTRDPREDYGAPFEGIAFREPDLTRLASCGVDLPRASLQAIVTDTLARHAEQARPVPLAACESPAF